MEIKIVQNVLAANDEIAAANREMFREKKTLAVNLMSSPGSGKTQLLDATLAAFAGKLRAAVIEGDITTTLDAERLAKHNAPLVQINTATIGGDCHLEASMIRSAASRLDLDTLDVVFIENVGNLVCPAEFELGEDHKVALLSVTEGEDKPLKYPLMFRVCDTVLLTKTDIVQHLDFDMDAAEANVRKINPAARILRLSAKSGAGMDAWLDFIIAGAEKKKAV